MLGFETIQPGGHPRSRQLPVGRLSELGEVRGVAESELASIRESFQALSGVFAHHFQQLETLTDPNQVAGPERRQALRHA
jgi:hypothetical protein